MEDAEADAVVVEGRPGGAVEPALEGAVLGAGELTLPREAQGAALVARFKGDAKGALALFDFEVRHVRRNSAPGIVTDRCKEASNELDVAETHIAKVDALELNRKRPGA
jgi:hypothetical protein